MLDFVMVTCTLRRDIASASTQWRNNFLFRILDRPCQDIDGGDDICDLVFRIQPLIDAFNSQLPTGQMVRLTDVQTNGLFIRDGHCHQRLLIFPAPKVLHRVVCFSVFLSK